MQQADVAALWLLEALVLTLPQSLLQAYVMVSTDVGFISPGPLLSPPFGVSSNKKLASFFFFLHFFPRSGLFLWTLRTVHFVGPGAVQQSLLSDTTRPLGHASSSHAVPAGLEGWHAGRKGGLPHVFCQGL